MLGITPSQYRAGGAGEEIKFAVDQSFLGAILVASSKKGVAAILLGDGPEKLVRDLQTLTASDRLWLGNKAGTTRLGFAVLLKMFQADGRFPHRLEEVPLAAVTATARQVEVPAEAWLSYDWRSRTAVYHRAQIRDALGFREVTLDDVDALTGWLQSQVPALEHRPDRLLVAARERCRSLCIEPPSPDRLDRLVRSVMHRHEEAWCNGPGDTLEVGDQLALDPGRRLDFMRVEPLSRALTYARRARMGLVDLTIAFPNRSSTNQ